jgi:predicted RNA-binding protein with PUA-like domain
VREAYPDPSQFDAKSKYFDADSTPASPRWSTVDVRFEAKFARPVALDEVRRTPELSDMVLVKRGRLSVQPVTPAEWKIVLALAARKSSRG